MSAHIDNASRAAQRTTLKSRGRTSKLLGPSTSFRRELFVAIASTLVLSALACATLVSLVIYNKASTLGRTQAERFVSAMAPELSYTMLIVRDDASAAKAAVKSLSNRPDVRFVQLLDETGRPLLSLGNAEHALDASALPGLLQLAATDTKTVSRAGMWHVIAPIVLRSSITTDGHAVAEHLGYLYVAWSQEQYDALYHSIINTTLIGSVVTVLLGFVWAAIRSRRLTMPIVHLAQTMDSATTTQGLRADERGSAEIQRMASAFNRLVHRLDEHRASLEEEVDARTAELRKANSELLTAIDDAKQAERFKSAFLAAVSHEMKTPLHAIEAHLRDAISELEFINDLPEAIQVRGAIVGALTQKEQLLSLISQILEYARAKAGRHSINLRSIDTADFTTRLRQTFVPIARLNGTSLTVDHEGVDHFVSDPDKLTAIAVNLISNACAFTQRGTIRVTTHCDGARLTLVVADNGRGIEAHLLSSVWEEFRQGEMGETRENRGTGLGLAVTKAFVELLGGTASIDSTKGVGTTVTVTIPTTQEPTKGNIDAHL